MTDTNEGHDQEPELHHPKGLSPRTITFEDSLKFERVHEDAYLTHGFEIVDIPPGAVAERASRVAVHLQTHT